MHKSMYRARWATLREGVMIRVLIFSVVLALTVKAYAQPAHRQCAGLLRVDRDGGLYIEVSPAGICKIAKSEHKKVLGRCKVNAICHLEGIADNCKDQGECSEVLQVLSAARGQVP
jgi:hypothetical protein